jgi:serpin B
LVLIIFVQFGLFSSAAFTQCPPDQSSEQVLVKSNNTFAIALYKNIKEENKNVFFSPYSISSALVMTYAGAKGQTAEQMADVLQFKLNNNDLHFAFSSLQNSMENLNKNASIKLNVANALWIQETYKIVSDFNQILKKYYDSEVRNVNFQKNADNIRDRINNWVAEKTENKIQNLIPAGMLTSMTRFVLVNAVYFKGKWEEPFNKNLTREGSFRIDSNKIVQVPFMNQEDSYNYFENDDVQILELPYVDNMTSMVIILPKKALNMESFERALTYEKFNQWLTGLSKQEVDVYIPKFKLEDSFNLNTVLSNMGMPVVFSDKADFSGITQSGPLFISAILHKAYVEVNEEGTEAAAATGVIGVTSAMPDRVTFKADHPFIFIIRHNETKTILFMGKYANPES